MNKRGFTLVELLAVIAILAILAIITLPNIINLFNEAKKNSFLTETKKIFNVAHEQWMSDSMFDTQEIVYAKCKNETCLNQLKLSGRDEINYYIKINKAGSVVEYYIEDGSYQYLYNGIGLKIEDIDNVVQIATINPSEIITITCDGTNGGSSNASNNVYQALTSIVTIISQQEDEKISVGDEVAIDNQHFYVVSSNELETVLLAKYNLLVGGTYVSGGQMGSFKLNKLYNASTSGYGLQKSNSDGTVPFSGTNYWDGRKCSWNNSGSSFSCSGTSGLISPYSSTGSYSGNNYPIVFNSSLSSTNLSIGTYLDSGEFYESYVYNNGYTVAYFTELYKSKLIALGAPNTISSRLLTYEEAVSLGCISTSCTNAPSWLRGAYYWLGSAKANQTVWTISNNNILNASFDNINSYGLRPVIVIDTSN